MNKKLFNIKNPFIRYTLTRRELNCPEMDNHPSIRWVKPFMLVLLEAYSKRLSVCLTYIQKFGFLACHFINCINAES